MKAALREYKNRIKEIQQSMKIEAIQLERLAND